MLGGALLGMWLQPRLPKDHLSKDSHETINFGIGVIATVTALVIGLMVSSAKSTYDTLNAGVVAASANIILLDQALSNYGPEAKPVREQLRALVNASLERLWPEPSTSTTEILNSLKRTNDLANLQQQLNQLTPQSDQQRKALAEAAQIAGEMMHSRWVLIEEAQIQFPTTLLVMLLFWLTFIFCVFGLFAQRNATVGVVMLACILSMACAIFLITDLNQPLVGYIKLSSVPMRDALAQLGQ